MTRSLLINNVIKYVLEHLHLHQRCYETHKFPFRFTQFRAGKFQYLCWHERKANVRSEILTAGNGENWFTGGKVWNHSVECE